MFFPILPLKEEHPALNPKPCGTLEEERPGPVGRIVDDAGRWHGVRLGPRVLRSLLRRGFKGSDVSWFKV